MRDDAGTYSASDAWRQIQYADRVMNAPNHDPDPEQSSIEQLLRAIAVGLAACASALEGR